MPDFIEMRKGAQVLYQGRKATIDRTVSLDQVLIKYDDGALDTVKVSELGRTAEPDAVRKKNEIPLDAYDHRSIEYARKRLEIIQPILDDPNNKTARLKEVVGNFGMSASTIYRWLNLHDKSPRLTSLISKASQKRKKRIGEREERVIQNVIEEIYFKPKRVTKKRVVEEVQARCKTARLKMPHKNTILARINEKSEKEKTKGRRSAKRARERHNAIKGKFPEGRVPLECVQMDTQKLDVQIVDTADRVAIGRPYLTLAIDTFSRMVVGYHLSLDAPSGFTAGACVHNMILPKDSVLKKYDIPSTWPVWGLPGNIHVDNGKDFRSKSLQRACEKHMMTIEFRLPGFPNWGGHIESFFGTLSSWVHDLDGTTKSNPLDRGDYNALKNSTMTLDELEHWLLTFIIEVYHNRDHSQINVPPIKRWRDGIEGKNGYPGIGLPPIPDDTRDLRLDFYPSQERTVSKYGIRWSKITYYSSVLDRWINEKKGGKSIKHIVRRDPHDISKLYFFDTDINEYFEIPYSNISHPTIDKWELERAQEFLAKQGLSKSDQDENAIFEGVRKMRAIEHQSSVNTAKITRKRRRKSESKQKHTPALVPSKEDGTSAKNTSPENVTTLPSKPKSKFSFSNQPTTAFVDDDLDEDYGEWS